jgi:Tol biopolymer transport system component
VQDIRDGVALMATHDQQLGIRGLPPGGKDERELGWLGWSELRDVSRDGKYVLFEEEGDGGGPNYTVFLRNTDGSPPMRIGEGVGRAISPDGKWVVTQPSTGGQLSLVPTGAGEARQLTHDSVSYATVRYFPDGKRLLASGIESGHGARVYVIDLNSGDSKPVTPEGITGGVLSPDGANMTVRTQDGSLGVWPLDGSGLRLIPGVDSKYSVSGWTPDGNSLYVILSNNERQKTAKVYKMNVATGKMDFWKEFGTNLPPAATSVGSPRLSQDGTAYAYVYQQIQSNIYVVTGLK